jgi:hypothetical protein
VSDKTPIYNVVIDAGGISLQRVDPGATGYRKARKNAVLRQRDAIERFQQQMKSGGSFSGVYSFQFLDTARTFAMLHLGALERTIHDNLDAIQAYDGSAKSSQK